MGSKQNGDRFTEEEMRIAKMISEGGLGVEAYYYMKEKDNSEVKKTDRGSNFISLGGLGIGTAKSQQDNHKKTE